MATCRKFKRFSSIQNRSKTVPFPEDIPFELYQVLLFQEYPYSRKLGNEGKIRRINTIINQKLVTTLTNIHEIRFHANET